MSELRKGWEGGVPVLRDSPDSDRALIRRTESDCPAREKAGVTGLRVSAGAHSGMGAHDDPISHLRSYVLVKGGPTCVINFCIFLFLPIFMQNKSNWYLRRRNKDIRIFWYSSIAVIGTNAT